MKAALTIAIALALISVFAGACAPATVPPTVTAVPPTAVPTNTPTDTPTPSPIPPTPTATPLPGAVVLPIDSMVSIVPWLPMTKETVSGVHFVAFNTKIPPFDNALVRQAFAHAIDREVIVAMAQKYGKSTWTAATSLTPPQTLGRDLYNQVGSSFDPQMAKELLGQAGYTDTSKFPAVKLIVPSHGDIAPGVRYNMAKAMAKMWQEHLGVTVTVEAIGGFKPYGTRIQTNPPELFWIGWAADFNDPENFMRIFHSASQNNYGKFSSAEYDQLVDSAAKASDPAKRQVLYIRAEQVLCESEAAAIPLYHMR